LNGKLNWRQENSIDSTKISSVKIKILNNKMLKIDFTLNHKTLKSKIIKYRLRNNGFIKLRNNNVKISGIPFIFGEYDVNKYEIALNNNRDLILHGIEDSQGGLIIILSSGFALEVNRIYKKTSQLY